jgi:hypothetical protein
LIQNLIKQMTILSIENIQPTHPRSSCKIPKQNLNRPRGWQTLEKHPQKVQENAIKTHSETVENVCGALIGPLRASGSRHRTRSWSQVSAEERGMTRETRAKVAYTTVHSLTTPSQLSLFDRHHGVTMATTCPPSLTAWITQSGPSQTSPPAPDSGSRKVKHCVFPMQHPLSPRVRSFVLSQNK